MFKKGEAMRYLDELLQTQSLLTEIKKDDLMLRKGNPLKNKGELISLRSGPEFGVDFLSGLGWCNQMLRKRWQFEKNPDGSDSLHFFEQVAPRVNASDRQRFVDDVCGLDRHEIITKQYTIHNGIQFIDKMNFYYHTEDYEFASPIKMEGRHIYMMAA